MTYQYDSAQRLLSKTYSDGTPSVQYCYDGAEYQAGSTPGCAVPSNRGTRTRDFPKRRLTGVGNSSGWTNYTAIDALGRPTEIKQSVVGRQDPWVVSYVYAASGAVRA